MITALDNKVGNRLRESHRAWVSVLDLLVHAFSSIRRMEGIEFEYNRWRHTQGPLIAIWSYPTIAPDAPSLVLRKYADLQSFQASKLKMCHFLWTTYVWNCQCYRIRHLNYYLGKDVSVPMSHSFHWHGAPQICHARKVCVCLTQLNSSSLAT